jgi:hypothetical protein
MLINPKGIQVFIDEFTLFSHDHESLRLDESKNHFQKLFSKFKEINQRIKTENEKTSYLFNPLTFFEIDENKMSELLAFLLNPKANHGQGDIYLREFCNHFGIDENFQNVFIETEHVTDKNRRIDIFIQINESYIVIENKYNWAADQENQLNDYFEYARNKNPQFSGQNVYCFYLTPNNGKAPSPESIDKIPPDNLKFIDFKTDIIAYLSQCSRISKNIKMEVFIDALISLINKENKMDQYQEEIFKWLAEAASRVNHAQQIYNIWQDFRLYLLEGTLKKLIEKVRQRLKQLSGNDEEWEIESEGDFRKAYSGIKITKKNWKKKYSLQLLGEMGQFNGIFLSFGDTHEHLLEEEKKAGAMIARNLTNAIVDFTKSGEAIAWKWSAIKDTWDNVDHFSLNMREAIIDTWTNELISFVDVLEDDDIKKKIIDLAGMMDSQ